jgi:hypothetical protein
VAAAARLHSVTARANTVSPRDLRDVTNLELLKPGMTATVHIVVDRRNEVLRVPAAALRYLPGELPAASGAARGQLEAAARARRPTP